MHLTTLLAISTAFVVVAANENDPDKAKKIVCPVNTKSMYQTSFSKFNVENVDLNLCTHIICLDQYWNDAEEPWAKEDANRYDDYKQLTDLRSKYPHLKVLLGIRRNNVEYDKYVKVGGFVGNISNFLSKHEFDGVDLRWTFSSGENEKFIISLRTLFKELKTKMEESNRLFTSSCNVLPDSWENIEDIKQAGILKIPDFIAIFNSYPILHTERDAMNARSFKNITEYVDDLLQIFSTSMQIERYQIVIGFPLDSPEFIKTENETKFSRFVDYNAICSLISTENWQKSFDEMNGLAIAKSEKNEQGEETSIVFESSRSIANKMNYAMSRELGGAMLSLLHKDDVEGKCRFEADTWTDFKPKNGTTMNIPKRNETNFTLLRTINEAIEIRTKKEPSSSAYNTVSLVALMGGILTFLLI